MESHKSSLDLPYDGSWEVATVRSGSVVPIVQGLSMVLVLCLSTTLPHTALGGSNKVVGSITELEGGLLPAVGGAPIYFEADQENNRFLAWGHEGSSDVRVLNDSLATLGVLPIPASSIQVKGVSMAEGGERAIVWGSTTNGTGDRLLFFDLNTFELDDDYMPAGLVPLATVDCARFFAWDVILAVAGRAANGTSQLVFVETIPMQVMRVDPVPDNLTVDGIYRDMSLLTCTLMDGSVLVYSTKAWSFMQRIRITDGPITASTAMTRPWIFGDGNGTIVYYEPNGEITLGFRVPEGAPIEAVALWEKTHRDAVIVAMSMPSGGAMLRTYIHEGNNTWVAIAELATYAHVSMMVRYPWAENVTLVGFEDGSLGLFEAHYREIFEPQGGRPGLWIASGVLLVVLALVVILMRRGRQGKPSDT